MIQWLKSNPLYVRIGVLCVAFIILIVLFMNSTGKQEPVEELKQVPVEEPQKVQFEVTQGEQPNPSLPVSDAQTSEQCIAEGGDWGEWGSEGEIFCQIPSQDAGKSCTGGEQCSYGLCMSTEAGNVVEGVCATYPTEFGCYAVINNGQVDDEVCID